MAILNRSLDISEQRKVFEISLSAFATGTSTYAVATGGTYAIGIVPYPCTLESAQLAVYGNSGNPSYGISIDRFIVGTGLTTIPLALGTSNVVTRVFGTSGYLRGASGMFTEAAGSTLLNLLAGDVLLLLTGGTTSAATLVTCGVVLIPIQDSKVHFGLK